MRTKPWLVYALCTTLLWGVWGAFTGVSARNGFPDTLVYCVWAVTMIAPGLIALARRGWKLEHDRRSILLGLLIGLLGAGGQLLLFYTVTIGPTYLIFPIISLSPVVTIGLSSLFLGERTDRVGALGIVMALLALPLFDLSFGGAGGGGGAVGWFAMSLAIMVAWGLQAFFMKFANNTMSAESIFIYMAIAGLVLAPIAFAMTSTQAPINWGWSGPGLAAVIQVLNAVGALTLVYAFRAGKAIVVAPLANAGAPLLTAVLSLVLLGAMPSALKGVGIGLATVAAVLLAISSEQAAGETVSETTT